MNLSAASLGRGVARNFPLPPSTHRKFLRIRSVLIIILLWAAIYAAAMFTPALLDDVDTVHAEEAREMVLRHDWVTLYTDGVRYLEKAPLMYWSVAASYKLFGISDWSPRLRLILTVLGMILATYGLGRWTFGAEGGFDSGLVL